MHFSEIEPRDFDNEIEQYSQLGYKASFGFENIYIYIMLKFTIRQSLGKACDLLHN